MTVVTGQMTNSESRAHSHDYKLLFLLMAVVGAYIAIALLLLRQWGQANPWSALDVFSGSGLLFNALLAAQQLRSYRQLPPSQEVKNEAFGYSFDPAMATWVSLLGLGELLIYLDYGHWHLMPALINPWLQWTGVVLSVLTLELLLWVDSYLVSHFASPEETRRLMTDGPYRWIRHPRYLGLILSRTASSLTFASIIGWVFLAGWIAVVIRRIRLEERHLYGQFGATYSQYSRNTSRLVPGLY